MPAIVLRCEVCGASFSCPPWKAATARFCSRACQGISKRRPHEWIPCAECGDLFPAPKPAAARRGWGRYCGKPCAVRAQNRARWGAAEVRFWSLVDKGGPPPAHRPELGPCWVWLGAVQGSGYGRFPYRGRSQQAHRVAWELTTGPIPEGLFVCHACDTPRCVNPAHLFLGDHAANMADMMAKGRNLLGDRHWTRRSPGAVAGERNGRAKLREAQVVAIRERYAAGGVSTRTLAAEYGVSRTLMKLIVRGDIWRTDWPGRGPGPERREREALAG